MSDLILPDSAKEHVVTLQEPCPFIIGSIVYYVDVGGNLYEFEVIEVYEPKPLSDMSALEPENCKLARVGIDGDNAMFTTNHKPFFTRKSEAMKATISAMDETRDQLKASLQKIERDTAVVRSRLTNQLREEGLKLV